MQRYAIYWAPPPESPLAAFAARWLGRDPWTGRDVPPPEIAGLSPERLREITASPRLYGFHGTLKAPFELAEGRTSEELHDAARAFARTRRPFAVPLELASLGGFLALVPSAVVPELDDLAAACVTGFEPFRAPASPADLARRRRAGLSPREDDHLVRYGYPYVFADFRFHLTLTERLPEPKHGAVRAILERLTVPFCAESLRIDAIHVFQQPDRASPFAVTGHYPFAG
mgnify:CR=1 FL=1